MRQGNDYTVTITSCSSKQAKDIHIAKWLLNHLTKRFSRVVGIPFAIPGYIVADCQPRFVNTLFALLAVKSVFSSQRRQCIAHKQGTRPNDITAPPLRVFVVTLQNTNRNRIVLPSLSLTLKTFKSAIALMCIYTSWSYARLSPDSQSYVLPQTYQLIVGPNCACKHRLQQPEHAQCHW